jgi:hypothetical protein
MAGPAVSANLQAAEQVEEGGPLSEGLDVCWCGKAFLLGPQCDHADAAAHEKQRIAKETVGSFVSDIMDVVKYRIEEEIEAREKIELGYFLCAGNCMTWLPPGHASQVCSTSCLMEMEQAHAYELERQLRQQARLQSESIQAYMAAGWSVEPLGKRVRAVEADREAAEVAEVAEAGEDGEGGEDGEDESDASDPYNKRMRWDGWHGEFVPMSDDETRSFPGCGMSIPASRESETCSKTCF